MSDSEDIAKAIADFERKTWIGWGLKAGGAAGFGGYETISGKFYRLSNTNDDRRFVMKTASGGVGLGGGGGFSVIFVFNSGDLGWLDGKGDYDWGVTLALGKRLDKLKEEGSLLVKYAIELLKVLKHGKSVLDLHIFSYTELSRQLYKIVREINKEEHPILILNPISFELRVSLMRSYTYWEIPRN